MKVTRRIITFSAPILAIALSARPVARADTVGPPPQAAAGADGTSSATGKGTDGKAPAADGGEAKALQGPDANATGGVGGTGGTGGDSGPGFNGRVGGKGSLGGPATATANVNDANTATAIGGKGGGGGNGGEGMNGGNGGAGNTGGAARATAGPNGTSASATANGGEGGTGGQGGLGNKGEGGDGGAGGKGGTGTATATTSAGNATADATGGKGGTGGPGGPGTVAEGNGGAAGSGGNAIAIANSKGADAKGLRTTVEAIAKGGNPGDQGSGQKKGDVGQGGNATARATGTTTGKTGSKVDAYARGGGVTTENGKPVIPANAGTAKATASSTTEAGNATSKAEAKGKTAEAKASSTSTKGEVNADAISNGKTDSKGDADAKIQGGQKVIEATLNTKVDGQGKVGANASGAIGGPAPATTQTAGLQGGTHASVEPNAATILAATANTPNVAGQLGVGSGGLALGLVSMSGANSTDTTGATTTVTDTADFQIDPTQLPPGSDLLVGLLDGLPSSLGFDTLTFKVYENGSLAANQTFDGSTYPGQSLSDAVQAYFDDRVLDLGPITTPPSGLLDVQFELDLTTHQVGQGFQMDLLFGVGPDPSPAPEPSTIILLGTALATAAAIRLARRRRRAAA